MFKQQNPGVSVQSRFAGSVELVHGVTQLEQPVDVLGVADASAPTLRCPFLAYVASLVGPPPTSDRPERSSRHGHSRLLHLRVCAASRQRPSPWPKPPQALVRARRGKLSSVEKAQVELGYVSGLMRESSADGAR